MFWKMCIRDRHDADRRVVIDDFVFGRDDVASLAVDQPHAGPRLNLGAAFVEVARPEELRRNHRVVVRIDESESAFVLDAYQPFEYMARPAVSGQLPHRIVDRFDVVYRLSGHGRLGDPAFQGLERLRIGPDVYKRQG